MICVCVVGCLCCGLCCVFLLVGCIDCYLICIVLFVIVCDGILV